MTETGHMGMSNMWRWETADGPQQFPTTPWALDLGMDDFPYPNRGKGEWFWETGFDKHPLRDLEYMRDWNLRAVYGAFNTLKHGQEAEQHRNARLSWVAYIGGPRESRRLLGDLVLTREMIVAKQELPDGTVPTTWDIDLHYPKKQYMKKYPQDPFISVAEFGQGVDKRYGYPVPYRCFYSRNIPNLFMAGRCISVSHEALGTVRVMRTCGMMGEVVGKAAAICVQYRCTPREVYDSHFEQLKELLNLPGATRRKGLGGEFYTPKDAPVLPPTDYLDPKSLPGLVVDDSEARLAGSWTKGENLKPCVHEGYRYASANSGAAARFPIRVGKTGRYEVRLAYQPHENRASNTPVTVIRGPSTQTIRINQKVKGGSEYGWAVVGTFDFSAGEQATVVVSTEGADGTVHIDAVQLVEMK